MKAAISLSVRPGAMKRPTRSKISSVARTACFIQPISAADLRSRRAETTFSAVTRRSAIPASARKPWSVRYMPWVRPSQISLAGEKLIPMDLGSDFAQELEEGLLDARDETDDLVVGAGLLDPFPVVEADDGPGPAVGADDEGRVPGDGPRGEEDEGRVAADLALAGEGDPAVEAELAEEAGRLLDLFLDEGHGCPPGIMWRND